ncbi:deoxyribose-phosphate aldolase [Acidipila sp. EB88]|uniref:deoxyribose-phosphate aldolase n=1 Tax=Acidipila sp. EB88 TaxID=2305226 RepID=UPI000F5E21BD|nr:deoxyribose-phosphate aldolase [Acidipila sp. EB88]RRA49523.1 deoxyribose-phosphate aldolase [Acidipila sp. EB88]
MYSDTPSPSARPASPPAELSQAEILSTFPDARTLASTLDHTLLKPEATRDQVLALALEAAEHRFACAMVNPAWVPSAHAALFGTGVRVGTVIGFPLGASLSTTKLTEAHDVLKAGALDVDMVLNIGALRSGLLQVVGDEIAEIARATHGEGAILKVILETCLLSDEEKRQAAELCLEAGADFVKTSTGFSTGGATVADIYLLRSIVGQRCGVKASGGIRTLNDAIAMAAAGAGRIGASASVAILRAYQQSTRP